MDLKLASKLIKYNPQDVQSTVYVVEYAQHNFKGDDVATYINCLLYTSPSPRDRG